jgi:pimeloyl-ACP methyl ester carboxylesterase
VPVLLVQDREDPDVPYGQAEQVTRAWPEARLVTTAGLGHRAILRDAAVARETVEFLRKGVTG